MTTASKSAPDLVRPDAPPSRLMPTVRPLSAVCPPAKVSMGKGAAKAGGLSRFGWLKVC